MMNGCIGCERKLINFCAGFSLFSFALSTQFLGAEITWNGAECCIEKRLINCKVTKRIIQLDYIVRLSISFHLLFTLLFQFNVAQSASSDAYISLTFHDVLCALTLSSWEESLYFNYLRSTLHIACVVTQHKAPLSNEEKKTREQLQSNRWMEDFCSACL